MKKIRGRGNIGDVLQIDLGNGQFVFGRVLPEPLMAFYDLISMEPKAASDIVTAPVLFVVPVMNYAVKSSKWLIVDSVDLEENLKIKPRFFKQDRRTKQFYIYDDHGDIPATREECIGLERAAVWEPEHIEDRLRDHFAGKRNKWVESMKPYDA